MSPIPVESALIISFCWLMVPGLNGAPESATPRKALQLIHVSDDGHRFVSGKSNAEFRPWGFNYDHDAAGRLLEEYWVKEWTTVAEDFAEMKSLGANTVRIHLQVSSFMHSPKQPNRASLQRLARLVTLAEKTGLYLDLTGLGCYDRKAVPQWYNDLDESRRWEVQARFWEAVASTCSKSPAIFCYDLMNEPILTGDTKTRDWTPGEFGGKCFVQRLTLDLGVRSQKEVAKLWVDKLVAAIRKHDRRHLVTVGAIPWALTWPTAKPLFYSPEVSEHLDFVSVHFYPKTGEVEKALTALAVYNIGKPLVVEETFPLSCSVEDLDQFIAGSKNLAQGWISFYWGKTIDEYKRDKPDFTSAVMINWLSYFIKKAPEMRPP